MTLTPDTLKFGLLTAIPSPPRMLATSVEVVATCVVLSTHSLPVYAAETSSCSGFGCEANSSICPVIDPVVGDFVASTVKPSDVTAKVLPSAHDAFASSATLIV